MVLLCSAARRHPHCRLYAILGERYGHTSWTFVFIQCCTVFMIQSVLLFLVKLFWHLLNSQLLQTNWLLGLGCASCFGTEDCLPKAVHRAQPFGMRAATLQLQVADRRCHQQGGNQLPDCHPIFAQMASEQAGHPSNLKTRLLTLTGRLCRPK